jgi:hypothetical protein
MSTANAKIGSAIESLAAQEITSQAQCPATTADHAQGILLAQIPDLDRKVTPKRPAKPSDGRIIGQSLSIKLIFGVGLGLVVGAILPFVYGRVSRPSPVVTELPAWSSNRGSPGTMSNTAQSMAPPWLPSATAAGNGAIPSRTASAPAPAILLPQPPQVGDTRPTALIEPSWSQPRPSAAAGPAATSAPAWNNYPNPPVAITRLPDNRADYRGFDRDPRAGAPDPRNAQADVRNDPATQYRNNDARYDYRGNPVEAAPVRRDIPASGDAGDTRYDNVIGNPPAASQGNPLMPSGPTSSYRDSQSSEPGVARFDGTIVTPPVRTSYDRAGSGNN